MSKGIYELGEHIKKNRDYFDMCECITLKLRSEYCVFFEIDEFEDQFEYTHGYLTGSGRNVYVEEDMKSVEDIVDVLKYRYIMLESNNLRDILSLTNVPQEDINKVCSNKLAYIEKYGEEEIDWNAKQQ